MYMLFNVVSNITIAFLELCCARNKPDKVSTIIQDMGDPERAMPSHRPLGARSPARDLAQEETDKILSYHSRCKCY